jgi:hypothetical protein
VEWLRGDLPAVNLEGVVILQLNFAEDLFFLRLR